MSFTEEDRRIECKVSKTMTALDLRRHLHGDDSAREYAASVIAGARNFIAEHYGVDDARLLLQGLLGDMNGQAKGRALQ